MTAQSVSTACPAGACSCVPANPEVVARDAAYIAKVRVDRVTGSQGDDDFVFTVVPEALYKGPGLAPTTIATRTAQPPLFEPWQVVVIGAGVVALAGLGVALLQVSRRRSRGRTDDDGRS